MKRITVFFSAATLSLFLTGCLTPVKNEVPLAGGDLFLRTTNTNETKLVIFNDSDVLLFGIDGSGRINVKLDGKGVAQLNIGRYAQVITSKGQHQVELLHLDVVHFRSHHSIALSAPESFLRIYATSLGNKIELVPELPPEFEKRFKPIHEITQKH
jgi:hypothetical protein